MALTRTMKAEDFFEFNNINLDVMTETYHLSFYSDYMIQWPELFIVKESVGGNLMGYSKF